MGGHFKVKAVTLLDDGSVRARLMYPTKRGAKYVIQMTLTQLIGGKLKYIQGTPLVTANADNADLFAEVKPESDEGGFTTDAPMTAVVQVAEIWPTVLEYTGLGPETGLPTFVSKNDEEL
jgi:hypothetical protein